MITTKMNKEMLIKLLQIHFEHKRKIDELKGKINLTYLEVDLLSLVLDAIGVPADNTIEQIEKYGYVGWLNQPDTFSRYAYYRVFEKQVIHGTYEDPSSQNKLSFLMRCVIHPGGISPYLAQVASNCFPPNAPPNALQTPLVIS